jgi:hypothetical protein
VQAAKVKPMSSFDQARFSKIGGQFESAVKECNQIGSDISQRQKLFPLAAIPAGMCIISEGVGLCI